MNVFITRRAERRIACIEAWWREHRPDTSDAFRIELREALATLAESPYLGMIQARRPTRIYRKWLLPTSQQHIVYVVDERRERLVVHTIWGAARGRSPVLR